MLFDSGRTSCYRCSTMIEPPAFLPSLIAALCWGGMFPVANSALDRVDAVNLTAVRYLIASLGFVALLAAIEGRRSLRLDGRGARVLLLGAAGVAGFNRLAFAALSHTTPEHAALVVATTPLVTVLARWAMTGERPAWSLLACIAVAFSGVGLVITKGDPSSLLDGGVGGGELMVLIGVVAWVRYTLGATEFAGWSPLRYTTLTAVAGTIVIAVIAAALDGFGAEHAPSAGDIGAIGPQLAYVAVLGALVAVTAWNAGVRQLGASNAALFMNLVPGTAFVIAAAQGSSPAAAELAGAGLTLAALIAANLLGRNTLTLWRSSSHQTSPRTWQVSHSSVASRSSSSDATG